MVFLASSTKLARFQPWPTKQGQDTEKASKSSLPSTPADDNPGRAPTLTRETDDLMQLFQGVNHININRVSHRNTELGRNDASGSPGAVSTSLEPRVTHDSSEL